jgi:argininosuccinate synthase
MNITKNKVVIAFSGGLDTTYCAVSLLRLGYEVITVYIDTIAADEEVSLNIAEWANSLGVSKHYTLRSSSELYERFICPIIKGNILRGGIYPICVGSERFIQAEGVVKIAHKENAKFVCHGCTGAGNDQVRFDIAIRSLDPSLTILAPIRDNQLTRSDTMSYLSDTGIIMPKKTQKYSINHGFLGRTIGGGDTHNSWHEVPEDVFTLTVSPELAPDEARIVTLRFNAGLPVAIDGAEMTGTEILEYLNKVGGAHGVGRNYHIGDTILGIKGRLAFEAPGITILIQAHRDLEKLVLTKWQSVLKEQICAQYGMLYHEGLIMNPVMRDIEAFIDSTQKKVSGEVKLKLYKGQVSIIGCKSQYSLMTSKAQYGEQTTLYSGEDAAGFCKIYGLQTMLSNQH